MTDNERALLLLVAGFVVGQMPDGGDVNFKTANLGVLVRNSLELKQRLSALILDVRTEWEHENDRRG